MTVSQLIEVLQTHPNDLRVVVNGYEDGFDDLSPEQNREPAGTPRTRAGAALHHRRRGRVCRG